jgi:hypothetical protein
MFLDLAILQLRFINHAKVNQPVNCAAGDWLAGNGVSVALWPAVDADSAMRVKYLSQIVRQVNSALL